MLKALRSKDALSGLLFIAIGLLSTVLSLDLPAGDSIRMGPGYIPRALAAILVGLGVLVLARSILMNTAMISSLHVRPLGLVLASGVAFGLTIDRMGLLLSIFLTVLIAAAAQPKWRRLEALWLAVGMSIFSSVLFVALLRLPIRLWP